VAALFVTVFAEAVAREQGDQAGVVFQFRIWLRTAEGRPGFVALGELVSGVLIRVIHAPQGRIRLVWVDFGDRRHTAGRGGLVLDIQQSADQGDRQDYDNSAQDN